MDPVVEKEVIPPGNSNSNSTPSSRESKKLPMVGNQSQSESQSQSQSQSPSPASGRLVYVRRKVEVDTNKPKEGPTVAAPTVAALVSESPPRWEERYHHLQMLLNKLDNQSHHTGDHVQMLWSLSSAELSKHAVELEKRSIHLSLEEAREMQRVSALNVLGRSVNTLKSTSNEGD